MEHATFAVIDEGESHAPRDQASYEADFHAWALRQAELIKLGRFHELDIGNLIDEVEDMARRERREFVSRLSLVFQHVLAWDCRPGHRSASWARTIREQRAQAIELLDESPSLRSHLDGSTASAFRQGRVAALNETGLPDAIIPEANPYAWHELMTRPVLWPEP